jgi:hypothetical protein
MPIYPKIYLEELYSIVYEPKSFDLCSRGQFIQ